MLALVLFVLGLGLTCTLTALVADGANAGPGLDPNGSDLTVSRPEGDRLAQARPAYAPNQQARPGGNVHG